MNPDGGVPAVLLQVAVSRGNQINWRCVLPYGRSLTGPHMFYRQPFSFVWSTVSYFEDIALMYSFAAH